MIIRSLNEITDTERDVKGALGTWRSKRLILEDDNVGFSLHETTVYPGTVTDLWYKNHYEAVLCVEGECEVTNRDSGEVHMIRAGTCISSTSMIAISCARRCCSGQYASSIHR